LVGIADSVKGFLAEAGQAQAALFAAACAERAAGILYWVVSQQGRADDLEFYSRALEHLWRAGRASDSEIPVSGRIESMRELLVGDEATGAAASALYGAIAMRSALLYLETGDSKWVADCSVVLEGHAFRLGRRSGVSLVESEYAEQLADIRDIMARGVDFEELSHRLRERALRTGRARLEIAVRSYGADI
jgi:hypothetical protein